MAMNADIANAASSTAGQREEVVLRDSRIESLIASRLEFRFHMSHSLRLPQFCIGRLIHFKIGRHRLNVAVECRTPSSVRQWAFSPVLIFP
jgi:hypothetical protein